MALETVDLSSQVVHKSLADLAREQILQDILQLRLHPGEIVQLKDLAQAYGMSRTPVREALVQMQASGLIKAIPYKGYRVRPLDKHDIEDVIFMRSLLEPAAAELAATTMTDEQLDELAALHPAQTEELNLEFDHYSQEFHTFVGRCSGSRRLSEMISMVYRDLARLQYAGLSRSVPTEIVAAHQEIIDALRSRDPQQAREVMRSHVLVVHAKALEEVRDGDDAEAQRQPAP